MQIRITAVKDKITAFGGDYAVYLVTFVDENQIVFVDKRVWCCKRRMICGDNLAVLQTSEDDFQEFN